MQHQEKRGPVPNGELARIYWPKRGFHDFCPSQICSLESGQAPVILGIYDLFCRTSLAAPARSTRRHSICLLKPATPTSKTFPLPTSIVHQPQSSILHLNTQPTFITTLPSIAMARTKQTARKVLPSSSSLSHIVANVVAVNWWQRSAHRNLITTSCN